jgi:FkbM family methyltransferase
MKLRQRLHFLSYLKRKYFTRDYIALKEWYRDNGELLRVEYPLTEDAVVIDVGGYKGDWSQQIKERYNCNIFICEPHPKYYEALCKKFSVDAKIKVFPYGLGANSGIEFLSDASEGSSIYKSGTSPSFKINIKSISEFIKENKITYVDLIKINIEGAEYELLEEMIRSGDICRYGNLQIQFHNFVPGAFKRMRKIQRSLARTHNRTYSYMFVWENWKVK